jgi:Kef-type K+ transport system membrane component KefB
MDYFSSTVSLLSAIGVLLLAAHAIGKLFERLRLPRVIGEIVGGLLLGPTLLSHFAPAAASFIVSRTEWNATVLPILSQAGLILLMFSSGTQLRSFVERGERKVVGVLAVIGIIIPFLAGLLAEQFIDTARLVGPANQSTAFLLVFATAIAIASIPVISRIMSDLGIMNTPFARIVISTAVIDDLVLYVVLAVALGLVKSPTEIQFGLPAIIGLDPASPWALAYHVLATIFLILSILVGGPLLLRFATTRRARPFNWDNGAITQIFMLAVVAAASKFLALNPMFGALAAGMVVGRVTAQTDRKLPVSLQVIGKHVLVPIYFALVGFKLDLIHHFDWHFFAGFLAFACAVKAVSIYAGARIAGKSHGISLNLAAALNARGGPGIVLASVAFDAKIINENFFAVLVLTAIATSLLAGWWLGNMAPNADGLRWKAKRAAKSV